MAYLVSIDFTLFDSSKVTSMENLFRGCRELEEIDFTNFNTSKVAHAWDQIFQGAVN